MASKICMFCYAPDSPVRVQASEGGPSEDARACNRCWKLLKDPKTALPMIRGHLTLTLRNQVPQAVLDKQLQNFMELMSKMKRSN